MGTVTLTPQQNSAGDTPMMAVGLDRPKLQIGTMALSSSYATGGDTFTKPAGFKAVIDVFFTQYPGYLLKYVPSTGAVMAYTVGSTTAEVTAATDLSAISVRYIAVGR